VTARSVLRSAEPQVAREASICLLRTDDRETVGLTATVAIACLALERLSVGGQ